MERGPGGWCRLTQPPAALGALQAPLECPEWAKELIFKWDSFMTLWPSAHPATQENITISFCPELEMVKLSGSTRHQSPLTKCYRLDLYGSNICRSRRIFDSISKTLIFPSLTDVWSWHLHCSHCPIMTRWSLDHPSQNLRLHLTVTLTLAWEKVRSRSESKECRPLDMLL